MKYLHTDGRICLKSEKKIEFVYFLCFHALNGIIALEKKNVFEF